MAIGLGRMFGFRFEENFSYPYISRSIGEFWRRWHISLGAWFRGIRLYTAGRFTGGQQEQADPQHADCMDFNGHVAWGAVEFSVLGTAQFCIPGIGAPVRVREREGKTAWRHLYVLLAVNLGWVLFRCESFYQLKEYMGNMFWMNQNGFFQSVYLDVSEGICMAVGNWNPTVHASSQRRQAHACSNGIRNWHGWCIRPG